MTHPPLADSSLLSLLQDTEVEVATMTVAGTVAEVVVREVVAADTTIATECVRPLMLA